MRTSKCLEETIFPETARWDETGFMWEIYNRIWGLERMSESPFGGRARGVPIHAVSPFREAFPVELLNRNHRQGHDSQSDYKFNCCAVANVVQFSWILPITGVSNDNEAFVANSRFSACVDIDCGRK